MKAAALVALVALTALGVGFHVGVEVGEGGAAHSPTEARGPVAGTVAAPRQEHTLADLRAFFEPGDGVAWGGKRFKLSDVVRSLTPPAGD